MFKTNYTNFTIPNEINEINVLYTVCECLVAVGAIVGNGLVLLAFRNERRLRRRTNYYIVSLAAADLLVGLLGIPFAILASMGLPTQLHACLFTVSLLVMLCTISIFSLVAVSADRYWAIIYPMGYSRNVTTRTAIGIIALCWVAGCLVGLLPLLGWNKGESNKGCRFVEVMDYNYLVFLYFATIIFPALLLLASYTHIYLVVRRQIRQMALMNPTPRTTKLRVLGAAQRREVKAARNLAIIVFFFIVCWIPLYTINCVKAFRPNYNPPLSLTNFCIILSHLNSAVNPLLYAYHLRDFRAALRSLLCSCTVEEINDNTVYGRNSIASAANRVHHIHILNTQNQALIQNHQASWMIPPTTIDLNGATDFRRRSLSTGDAPISSKNETEFITSSRPANTDTNRLCGDRVVHSESSVWYAKSSIRQRNRCYSADVKRRGLENSGFEDDTYTQQLLTFTSLPPIETQLALQVLTRPVSTAASCNSHENLILNDKNNAPPIQIQRCEGLETEVFSECFKSSTQWSSKHQSV